MKKLISTLLFSAVFSISAQDNCNLPTSELHSEVKIIDKEKLQCLAQNSENKTLFLTFGVWCQPCREELQNNIDFAKEHQLNFYVIIVEPEQFIKRSVNFLKKHDENIKILSLHQDKRFRKNYRSFLKEITPPHIEVIDDMSKHILVNHLGEVETITSYKDNKQGKNGARDKILSFLKK